MVKIDNRDDYFVLAGQVAYYLASQSAAKEKTFDLVIDIDSVKTVEKLRNKLIILKKSRDHALSLASKEFKKAIELLLSYELDEKITNRDKTKYVLGTVQENVFYQKKEKKNDEEK